MWQTLVFSVGVFLSINFKHFLLLQFARSQKLLNFALNIEKDDSIKEGGDKSTTEEVVCVIKS